MPACPGCGVSNPKRARFCLACGTALQVPNDLEPAGSRRTVTVLFSDVVGSTALGELLDPETVHVVMSRYFDVMQAVIERHGGTVEKFIGDAVMAVFGLPVLHDDDAVRAVRAATDMRDALATLNADLRVTRGIEIAIRIGINTGEVLAGRSSSRQTLVTGDPVNTAARLEQAAGPGEILVGRETWRLVRDIAAGEQIDPIGAKGKADPVPAVRLWSVARMAPPREPHGDAPMLGRDADQGRIEAVFASAIKDRTAALVTIVGPAGVGKSRLVNEFLATVTGRASTLRGRCLSYGDGITYWPLREVLHAAASIRDSDTPDAGIEKLRALLSGARDGPLVADRLASAIGLSTVPASRDEVFWAARRVLEHLARNEPLVVVIEDIHWAEPTLLEFLAQVVELSRDVALVVLCPARPELLDASPDWGTGRSFLTRIVLDGLTREQAGALLEALPGGTQLPSDLRERILATADGNPLFIEEMLRMLTEDGLIGDGPDAVPGKTGGRVQVPPTIQALMAARLDHLPTSQRSAAQRAAVVGRIFEKPAVVALTPSASRPDVAEHLLALVRKELLAKERSGLTEVDAFKFRHILARDAAYDALAKSERASLHERFADWLEGVAGERLNEYQEILGYHLAQAYRYRNELREPADHTAVVGQRAGSYLRSAGRRARDRGDSAAAVQLCVQALALPLAESTARAELLLEYGLALFDVGRLPEIRSPMEEALDIATRTGDPRLAARARLLRIDLGQADGTFVASDPALESEIDAALRDAEASGDNEALAAAWQARSAHSWSQSRVGLSDEQGRVALSHARAAGDERYGLEIELNLMVSTFAGPLPASQVLSEVAGLVDRAASFPTVRAEAQLLAAVSEAMLGQFDMGRSHAAQAIATLLDLAQFGSAVNARTYLAWTERLAGDLAAAEEILRLAISEADSMGDLGLHSFVSCRLAEVLVNQGRFDEALIPLTAAERNPIGATRSRIAGARAKIAAAGGDATVPAQVDALLAMVAPWPWLNVRTEAFIDAAQAMATAGDPERAAVHAREALRLCEAKENVALAGQVRHLLARLEA